MVDQIGKYKSTTGSIFTLVDSNDVHTEEIIEIFSDFKNTYALTLSKPEIFNSAKLCLVVPTNDARLNIFFNKTYQNFFQKYHI